MTYRKKLIEVALPLDAINEACTQDKNRKTGHIRNLHKWFAPMPLPAWRAVLLASVLDDPSNDQPEEQARTARKALFDEIERILPLDAPKDPKLLEKAVALVAQHSGDKPPTVLDPFCGGGSTLVEAQRLGFPTVGSDLNPVPALISRVVATLPPIVSGRTPLAPAADARLAWPGLTGFEFDVRHYARVIQKRAMSHLEPLYPATSSGTPYAYRWAWTVASPDPAAGGAHTPLVSSWWLAKGKRKSPGSWVEATYSPQSRVVEYSVREGGVPPDGTVNRRGATCLVSGAPISFEHVRQQGREGNLRLQLIAVAAMEGKTRRFLSPDSTQVEAANVTSPTFRDIVLPKKALGFRVQAYGFKTFGALFTARQQASLHCFSGLVAELHAELVSKFASDPSELPLEDGGRGSRAYIDAIATMLGLCVGKMAQSNNVQVRWFVDPRSGGGKATPAFDKQVINMVWDFVETNPFGGSVGDWCGPVLATALQGLGLTAPHSSPARVVQQDARSAEQLVSPPVIVATDPPYYDNIGYADLSDFFYLWLRPALRSVHPSIFRTLATPKSDELIAAPARHSGSRDDANAYFRDGFKDVFFRLAMVMGDYPMSIVYAMKQNESGRSKSTGWDVFLQGLIDAGLAVVATWPVRTTTATRMRSLGSNALASAVVVVCRKRGSDARISTRRAFRRELSREVPEAVRSLQVGSIAPVDLAQAAIGPGMRVFSQYSQVLEADGNPMTVGAALGLINEAVDGFLAEQAGEMGADTRFAVTWFESFGYEAQSYGRAETLARARNVSVAGVVEAGIIVAKGGLVRLLRRDELPADWDPTSDSRPTVWEALQHLVKRLEEMGEQAASVLLGSLGPMGEQARDLCYRLFSMCEKANRTEDALAYNALAASWPELVRLSAGSEGAQAEFFQ